MLEDNSGMFSYVRFLRCLFLVVGGILFNLAVINSCKDGQMITISSNKVSNKVSK